VNALRAIAVGLALVTARRVPTFGVAAGLLCADVIGGELAEAIGSGVAASLGWGAAPSLGGASGIALGDRRSVHALGAPLLITIAAISAAGAGLSAERAQAFQLLTAALVYAFGLVVALRGVDRPNAGHAAVFVLLALNVVACALPLLVGIDMYAVAVELINAIGYLCVVGLAAWTMRTR
jgi:hypothetical protein